MLKRVKKANLFSKNRPYNRNVNDRRNQPQHKRLSAGKGAGAAAEIGDAPLLTVMPARLMLAHCLGHFCCFYVNDTSRTPQLRFPPLQPHEKDPLITCLLLTAFRPISFFPHIAGTIELVLMLNKSINSATDFNTDNKTTKPPLFRCPRAAKKGKTEGRGGNTSHE